MKTLVIAEKPSVARDIARVLGCAKKENGALEGNQYIVTWALGHLVTLKDPEDYDKKYKEWNMAVLPMMPEKLQIKVIPQTGKQYHAVTTQLARKDVGEVVIATDAGREGELVARWILDKAHNQKPCKRLWISSVTDKAIREGFASLKDAKEYDNLYRAAVSRAEADWLVGINATRALTCKYNAQLSCGRVQTPTLAMIAQREQEIREFVPKPYYTVMAAAGGAVYTWKDEKSGGTRISDPEKAKQIAEKAKRYPLILQKVEKKKKQKEAPLLYDLTELQRDASARFGYSAKQTLNLMQSLYETHKVLTYPRTDSRYLTKDIVPTLKERLDAVSIGPYKTLAQQAKRRPLKEKPGFVNDAKVSDHHAIIPTMELAKTDLATLPESERNILTLAGARLLMATAAPHTFEAVTAVFECAGQSFTAKGKTVLYDGWKEIDRRYRAALKNKPETDDADSDTEKTLPPFTEGQTFENPTAKVTEHDTTPPKPHNEASLLSAMEHAGSEDTDPDAERKGLGTPATRAAVIEKLVKGGFVERKGKQLLPTKDGINLVCVLPDTLTSPQLTAEWENNLTQIAKGKADPAAFMEGIEDMARELVKTYPFLSDDKAQMFKPEREALGSCPRCGSPVYEGKKNYYCSNKECIFTMWKNDRFFEERKVTFTPKIAAALLQSGKVNVKKLYSPKTGKTYDGTIVLADTGGKYVNYRVELPKKK